MSGMDTKTQVRGQGSEVGGQAEKGFTLIELLITIAIAAILGSIAVMNTPQMIANYRVRGAARQVYADMQMARLRAIKEGKEWVVDFTGTTYTVKIKGSATAFKTMDIASEYPGVSACSITDAEFKPTGTTTVPGGSIILYSRDRYQKVYVTSTGTGNIKIKDITKTEFQSACP